MFVATNIVKSSDKEKWLYSDYGIAFDDEVHGILVKNLLGMLQFLVLTIFYHLILIMARISFNGNFAY